MDTTTTVETLDTEAPRWNEHPLRQSLAGELHTRPFLALEAPLRASHIAMLSGEGGFAADFAHITALCRHFGREAPQPAKHFNADLGSFSVRWERHSEFCTYTFFRTGLFTHPFEDTALSLVPVDWLDTLPGKRLVAAHLAIEPRGTPPHGQTDIARYFHGASLAGSRISGGSAVIWTDFQLHADGFSRFLIGDTGPSLIVDAHLHPLRAGRIVQRLLEIETYRMMALLSLPLAQSLAPEIDRIEAGTSEIAGALAGLEGLEETREMLSRLSRLSGEIEAITARSTLRFEATRAYYELVKSRTDNLREERIEGFPTIDEYLQRRLAPAMATCAATAQRIETLSRRLARANSLLSTRVNVGLEAQNRDLLQSMDRRAQLQARLASTLDVISTCAVTYYLSLLLGHVLVAAVHAGIAMDVEFVNGLAIPVILVLVAIALRWARRTVMRSF